MHEDAIIDFFFSHGVFDQNEAASLRMIEDDAVVELKRELGGWIETRVDIGNKVIHLFIATAKTLTSAGSAPTAQQPEFWYSTKSLRRQSIWKVIIGFRLRLHASV